MPWIIAGAALVGTALTTQQQSASSAGSARASAAQGQQSKSAAPVQPFTPTAQSSQASAGAPGMGQPSKTPGLQEAYSDLATSMSNQNAGQGGSAPPPTPGGGSNAMAHVNQAAQLGGTLQQIFQNEQAQGQNARMQALAGRPQASAQPYRPTALNQMDPRLQQLLGR